MLPIDSNYTESKNHSENYNSNYDSDRVDDKKWELDNLKGPE